MKTLNPILLLFFLMCFAMSFAQEQTAIKVVNLSAPGNLSSIMGGDNQLVKTKRLKIIGPFNAQDVITIKRIPYLTYLDLKDAKVVPGGKIYDSHYDGEYNETKNDTIGDYMFCANQSLVNIYLPATIKFIGKNAFEACISLEEVAIPEGVNTIFDDAFARCTKLASVTFNDNISCIGTEAFEKCLGLKSIILPAGLKELGNRAFDGCTGLISITCLAKLPLSSSLVADDDLPFGSPDISEIYEKATLYVPIGSKVAYMQSPFWKLFKNIIEK